MGGPGSGRSKSLAVNYVVEDCLVLDVHDLVRRGVFICRQTGTSLEMIEKHYGNARVDAAQLNDMICQAELGHRDGREQGADGAGSRHLSADARAADHRHRRRDLIVDGARKLTSPRRSRGGDPG